MTRKRWRNPDKRMAQAVELRGKGWSLRRIGTELAVSEGTIRNDLARWQREKDVLLDELEGIAKGNVVRLRPAGQTSRPAPKTATPRGARPWWVPATRPRWDDPEYRMARAGELRAEGRSLRQIAAALGVSAGTVRSDLARRRLRNSAVQLNADYAGLNTAITQDDA